MAITVFCPLGCGVVEEHTGAGSGFWKLPSALEFAHANRQRDWLAGREALASAALKLNCLLDPATFQIEDHHWSPSAPDLIFSISHCDDRAAAWALPANIGYCVGFDLEKRSRELSETLARRIVNDHDPQIPAICLWSAKEAIFKCLSASQQQGLPFSAIVLRDKGRFEIPRLSTVGCYDLQEREGYIYAFAWTGKIPERKIWE